MRRIILITACILLAASTSLSQQQKRARPKTKPIDLSAGLVEDPAPTRAELEKKIKALESRVSALSYKLSKDDSVELDTSSDVYQRVNSNNASFLMRVAKVEPYMNGYKVFLAIGNMTTATFSGFDLSLTWATKEPEASENFDGWAAWYKARKEKDEHFPQDILPGRWNQVEVILTPARVDELGYLRVSIKTNAVSLRGN